MGSAAQGYEQGKEEAGPALEAAKQAAADTAASAAGAVGELPARLPPCPSLPCRFLRQCSRSSPLVCRSAVSEAQLLIRACRSAAACPLTVQARR